MDTLSLFGKDPEFFCNKQMQAEYDNGGIDSLKAYLLKHFCKTKTGYLKAMPGEQSFAFPAMGLTHQVGGPKRELKRSSSSEKCTPYEIVAAFEEVGTSLDPFSSGIYATEKPTRTYINMFGGYPWPKYTTNNPPTAAEMKKIQHHLDHIFIVYANRNKAIYDLVIRWFARPCQGKKNVLALYLHGPQRVGKSVFFEFMQNRVTGEHATLMANTGTFIGNFNESLAGKILVFLEEPDAPGKATRALLNNALKTICTASKLLINGKNTKEYVIPNRISPAILTNRPAMEFDNDDGRWVMLDINTSLKGNTDHFNKVWGWQNNSELGKEEGEIMWRYLRSIDISINDRAPPRTVAKAATDMPDFIKFVKADLHQTANPAAGITTRMIMDVDNGLPEVPFDLFHQKYQEWLIAITPRGAKPYVVSKNKLGREMTAAEFERKKKDIAGTTRQMMVPKTIDEIERLLESKGWINEHDIVSTDLQGRLNFNDQKALDAQGTLTPTVLQYKLPAKDKSSHETGVDEKDGKTPAPTGPPDDDSDNVEQPAAEHVAEPAPKPVAAAAPAAAPATKPAAVPAAKPAVKPPAPKPAAAAKPAAKPAVKQPAKPAPKPAAKPVPKPAAKPAPEPAAKPAAKTAAKAAPKPQPRAAPAFAEFTSTSDELDYEGLDGK